MKKYVSKLVDDGELPLQTNLLAASLQQFMDESRGGVEADRQLLLAGREIEPILPVPLLPTAMMLSGGSHTPSGPESGIHVDCAKCDLALVQSADYIPRL